MIGSFQELAAIFSHGTQFSRLACENKRAGAISRLRKPDGRAAAAAASRAVISSPRGDR
jgi:hypothetical protein